MPYLVAPILAPGEEIPISIEIGYGADIMLKKRLKDGSNLNEEQKFAALLGTANDTGEIVIEYQDVFGSYFRAVHPNGAWMDFPGDIAAQQDSLEGIQSVLERPDRRPATFLEGRQASEIESAWWLLRERS